MNPAFSEQHLIAAIRSRSTAGAEMLYDTYAINLHKVILSIVRKPELADQALEQTFLNIRNTFDESTTLNNRLGIWVMGKAKKPPKLLFQDPKQSRHLKMLIFPRLMITKLRVWPKPIPLQQIRNLQFLTTSAIDIAKLN